MKSLLDLQQYFEASILQQNAGQSDEILKHIKDNNLKFSVEKRMGVYRYAFTWRMEKCLSEDFPLLTKSLGEENLKTLWKRYLKVYPSRTFNLAEVGLNFAKYLSQNPDIEIPYLAELARFEVEKLISDHASANPESLSLAGIAQEDLSTLRLIFDMSVRLFTSEWSLLTEPISKTSLYLLFYEWDYEMKHLDLTKEMHLLIKNLLDGQSLPQAASNLADDQAPAVSALFSDLVRLKIVIGFERKQ